MVLRVDAKGRIQIPKEIRKELGIGSEVNVTIEDSAIAFEPVKRTLEKLASEAKFNYKSIKHSLPELRKAAEEELMKQSSWVSETKPSL